MFSIEAFLIFFVLFAIVVCLSASIRILREYERAVVFHPRPLPDESRAPASYF